MGKKEVDKGEVLIGRFEGQSWKLWPHVRKQIGHLPCPSCGKQYADHSDEEFDFCMRNKKPESE
jgi:hypothetical protein